MADLRERLEAAEKWCVEMSSWQYFSPRERRKIAKHAATLREVLAHPEKLMGEPVAWADPLDIKDAADEMVGCTNNRYVHISKTGNKLRYTLPLYAPEVKP